jgi:hypothetical protein
MRTQFASDIRTAREIADEFKQAMIAKDSLR